MSFENIPTNLPKPEKKTPKRLMLASEAFIKLGIDQIKINGQEHLKEIPPNRKVIIATTHFTDLDMPLAIKAVGDNLDIVVADKSTHHHLMEEPQGWVGFAAGGKKNFLPVDFKQDSKAQHGGNYVLNPDNFEDMNNAMSTGKSILISGQRPVFGEETSESGYGAAYLAEIANAVILPIGVNVKAKDAQVGKIGHKIKTIFNRSDADITIGAPIELARIEGFEKFVEVLQKRKNNEKVTHEEKKEFSRLKKLLQEQSQTIFDNLIELAR